MVSKVSSPMVLVTMVFQLFIKNAVEISDNLFCHLQGLGFLPAHWRQYQRVE